MKLPAPYLQRLPLKTARHTIWLVDDEWVRQYLNPEFCNYGQHYRFPFIPPGEFWFAQMPARQLEHELGYFVQHLTTEFDAMESGADYSAALRRADRWEAKLRRDDPPSTRSVHERRWRTLPEGLTVWLVNSGRVRAQHHDPNFAAGGHPLVYPYVPEGEIWIDSSLRGRVARELCLLHELYEYHLMARGIGYDEAHEQAINLEAHARAYPQERAALLAREVAGDPDDQEDADDPDATRGRRPRSASLSAKVAGARVRARVGSESSGSSGASWSPTLARPCTSVRKRASTRGRSA